MSGMIQKNIMVIFHPDEYENVKIYMGRDSETLKNYENLRSSIAEKIKPEETRDMVNFLYYDNLFYGLFQYDDRYNGVLDSDNFDQYDNYLYSLRVFEEGSLNIGVDFGDLSKMPLSLIPDNLINYLAEIKVYKQICHSRNNSFCKTLGSSHIFTNKKNCKVDKYNKEEIEDFDDTLKTVAISSRMGTHKTRKLIKYMSESKINKPFIFITCRRSLGLECKSSFADIERPLYHYTELKKDMILKNGKIFSKTPIYDDYGYKLDTSDFLEDNCVIIIQLESVYKLDGFINNIGVVVFDECTSLMKQLSSKTMTGKFTENTKMLECITQKADKVIFMDGDLDERTHIFAETMRGECNYFINENKFIGRNIIEHDFKMQMFNEMVTKLRDGKKLYVCCSYKIDALIIERWLRELIPSLSIISHTSETSVRDFDDLQNVETVWLKNDVVITTSVITCGINFHPNHFDATYVFARNRFCCNYRDMVQMIHRVRNPKTLEVHVNFDTVKMDKPTTREEIKSIIMNNIANYNLKSRYEKDIDEDDENDKENSPMVLEVKKSMSAGISPEKGLSFMYEEESYLCKIHLLNVMEENLSSNMYRDAFLNSMINKGYKRQIIEHSINKKEMDDFEDKWKITKAIIKEELIAKLNNTKNISPQQAAEIKVAQSSGLVSQEQEDQNNKYRLAKWFVDPNQDGKTLIFFEKNKTECLNVFSNLKYATDEVKAIDKVRFKHSINFTGLLDKYLFIKKFFKMLGHKKITKDILKNFKFDTFLLVLPEKAREWLDLIEEGRKTFSMKREKIDGTNVKAIMTIVKEILYKWGKIRQIIEPEKKEKQINKVRYQFYEYTFGVHEAILVIVDMLKICDTVRVRREFETMEKDYNNSEKDYAQHLKNIELFGEKVPIPQQIT